MIDANNRWEWRVDPDEQPPFGSRRLLPALVTHMRENRIQLRDDWIRRMTDGSLLTAMTPEELLSESTAVYDHFVEMLETGEVEALQAHTRELSERLIRQGIETEEVLGVLLLLRDVLARSLFDAYKGDVELLSQLFDAYEPTANRLATTVGATFVHERERAIGRERERAVRQQQEDAIRQQREALREQQEKALREQEEALSELSTPVLQMREGLLILPIIGALDPHRTHQLSEQLLGGIREHRAKIAVIDLTGVPEIDSAAATYLIQAVQASRLLGASVIITGVSPAVASSLATSGVDLSKMNAVGDLQSGIEHAERLLDRPSVERPMPTS